ncbi:acyl-CoA dehydrogenase family protein [Nocardia alni]|uniref:acyl-CoA dehydrogenase family protein n=1 Tax=Nocardia alni TaxID=2815723 RepID=UPI001C241E7D|nr:acyl-CoA dehydrogenase family protein [Nocardia alni]
MNETAVAGTEFAEIHDEVRAVARDLLGRSGPGARIAPNVLAAQGWLGLEVPEALDGAGASFAETAIVLEELGRAVTGSACLGTVVLGVGTLGELVASPGRDALLRAVASGDTVVASALPADLDDGLAPTPFHIERSADGPRLYGRAEFVPDACSADHVLFPASDAGVPVIVSVAADATGLSRTAQEVLDETREFGTVTADGLAVPRDSLWSFAGDPAAARARIHDRAAVAIACDSLGLGEAMLAATVAYAGAREQFGRPIGSFQAVKHACADMLAQVTMARRLVTAAVGQIAANDPDAWAAAAMAKSYTCTAAVHIAGKAMQLHGGFGYTWESGIHRYLERATLNRALFGAPAAHRRRLSARYAGGAAEFDRARRTS